MSRVLRSVGVVPVLRRPLRRYVSRPAGHKQQLEASTRKSALARRGPASARDNEVRRASGHDRVNCRLGTSTVDALQLLQRLLSRFLVSYRPLANI